MADDPLVPYLQYQVLHPVTGTVLISNLQHTNSDKWDVRFMQGASSAASIGTFEIPLIPPGAEGHKAAKADYDKLDYGQRIEGYLGKVGAGDPKFSGVIRKLPKDIGRYSITGEDSISLLRDMRTNRSEYLSLGTDKLFKFALRGWSLVKGDDFTGDLSAYTNNASWTQATYPDNTGMKCVTNSTTGGIKWLYTTTSYANANYADCFVEGIFRVTMGTDATIAGEAGIVAALTDTNNYIYARAFARYVAASTRWEIDAEIHQVSAGVDTRKARLPIAIVMASNPLRLAPLQLIGKRGTFAGGTFTPDSAGADYLWRLVLNGYDGNCTWVQTGAGASTSGAVGLRWFANAGGAPQVWATQLCFANRTAMFQNGAVTVGSLAIAQTLSEAQHLDIIHQAAITEGFQFRKNPKTGLNNDTMDFGAIGADLTASVRFTEGDNLVTPGVSLEPNAEAPATDIRLQIAPGPDAAEIVYRNLSASGISKYGWRTETVQAQNMADTKSAINLSKTVSDLKAKPGTAKRFTVYRDAATADKWREGDTVLVHQPTSAIFNAPVLVQGYTFYGGKPTMDIIGDQYSLEYNADYQIRRIQQTIERLSAGVSGVTPSGPSGLVYDNRYGTPYIANWPSGLQPVSTGFPCRIIFFIPTNLLALQKVTVSFALVAFRSGQQSTSAGGSAHNHSVSGQTASATTSGNQGANHLHTITINSGLAGNTVFYDSLGVGLQASTGGTVGTSTENATHTHGVPATAVSAATSSSDSTHTHALNAPNAIYETGAASGATVILDGTTILAGPYNADQFELDITQFLTGSGKHEVQITSTALGGIFGHVQVIGLVKSN